jgi:PAS domain S-box-containing protein
MAAGRSESASTAEGPDPADGVRTNLGKLVSTGGELNLYERLVHAVVDYALFMLDADGRVVSWNPGAERLKGWSADEIMGRPYATFFTPEDRAAGVPDRALAVATEKGRYEAEGWRVRKDGTRFWALAVLDTIRDEDGRLLGFAKITRDMTERRETEERLRESERRFRLLVEGVTDYALFMLDPNGVITNWNTGAERIKGYKAEEVIGRHFSMFYTPEDADGGVPQRALQTARREGRYEAEGWRMRRDGTRFWASVLIDSIYEHGELVGYAKVTRDISEKRDAELRLEETRNQLFQAQKMEALGQLTGGLAHDFNNLLTAIISGAELGLRKISDTEAVRRYLEGVRAAALRGSGLTRQLLAFARRQPLELKAVDLKEQLPVTADLLRHSMRPDIRLSVDIPDDLACVESDPGQLELAVLNLGFNARDAMPKGGAIRISARNVMLDGQPDGLRGPYVAIEVADTGPGIPPEIRDRIFEPFFTTKSFGKGTGLGLSQVYGFARQAEGTITLESGEGKGATFTLYLRAAQDGASGKARHLPSETARVLVVDDDPVVAELAQDLMRELGYEAVVVSSSAEALDALARKGPFDLVFSDVIMPGGLSGVELARKVRNRHPELPVLLTTGYSDRVGSIEFPVVAKPYSLEELADQLRQLIRPAA